jgi:hypothetical protein
VNIELEYRAWSVTIDELNEKWEKENDRESYIKFITKLNEVVGDALDVAHRGTRIEFRPKEKRFGGLFNRHEAKNADMVFLRKCHLNMIATGISQALEAEGINCTPHIFDYKNLSSGRVEYELGDL